MLFKRRKQKRLLATQAQQTALQQTFRPLAIGQILAALESLSIRGEHDSEGYLRGLSSREYKGTGLKGTFLRALDSKYSPKVFSAASLGAASLMLLKPKSRAVQVTTSLILAISSTLSELRTPYGRDGADQMSSLIFQYRVLTSLIHNRQKSDDLLLRAINFQTATSYATSGLSKAFGSSWVQGDALYEILQTENYGNGPLAKVLKRFPTLCRVVTRFTVVWETLFPVIYLLPPSIATQFLNIVKLFHLAVALTMELPRFLWGYLGAHGAVSYMLTRSRQSDSGQLEGLTALAVGGILIGSVVNVTEKRQTLLARRNGIGGKGSDFTRTAAGHLVEYQLNGPVRSSHHESGRIFLLENGLGEPMESWSWITELLSKTDTVIRYHRPGYGQTDKKADHNAVVSAILNNVSETAPIVLVTHSIGLLSALAIAKNSHLRERIESLVVLDGTDPGHLEEHRTDRKKAGAFLQSQAITLLASLFGFYNWAPNAVERQASYTPDVQFSYVTSVFFPPNIINATKEYFSFSVDEFQEDLGSIPQRLVIASDEYYGEAMEVAKQLDCEVEHISGSTHRSMLGDRNHAEVIVKHMHTFLERNE